MELIRPLASKNNVLYFHSQALARCLKPCSRHSETPQNVQAKVSGRINSFMVNEEGCSQLCSPPVFQVSNELKKVSRRIGVISTAISVLLVYEEKIANASELGLELTTEEAKKGVRINGESLLEVKALLEAESWREAQKVLRKSASNLKKDMYAIIQNKPGSERPLLRKLYSHLFTNVSKLDYAARDQDASRVWECYNNIVAALDQLMSRI